MGWNVLFVDDNENILQGLKRLLRPLRDEWQMEFANSGERALELLSQIRFDVIVTDMKMPRMDGAQLLEAVMERHPQSVRIVLSGHSDEEMVMRAVGVAHQYLSKPCDCETLKSSITRALHLRRLLADPTLNVIVSRIDSVPSVPSLYQQIIDELRSPNGSIKRIGEIIGQDIGMTAKILKLVNSAFFSVRREITSPSQAVALLGLETIKGLVLSHHVFNTFRFEPAMRRALEGVAEHSLAVAALARDIAIAETGDKKMAENSFVAGLLHDLGKLVLGMGLAERYARVLREAERKGTPLWMAEKSEFGTTHAAVGAYLLGLWGLPDPILEAVAFHHVPSEAVCVGFTPLTAVHVANELCRAGERADAGPEGEALGESRDETAQEKPREDLDLKYLEGVGLQGRTERWAGMCGEIRERTAAA